MDITEIYTENGIIMYLNENNIKPKNYFKREGMKLSVRDVSIIVEKFNLPIERKDYKKYKTLRHIFVYAPTTEARRRAIVVDVLENGLLSKEFCIYCGKQVYSNYNYCVYCGGKL